LNLQSQITGLLLSARRRRIAQLILDQGAGALALAMVAFILLLLLGTQVLDWYWPVAVFLLSLLIGVWRTRDRFPSPYQVLQQVDERMRLHDALSTSWFFDEVADPSRSREAVRAAQRQRSEELARTIDVEKAVPFTMPRSAYAAIAAVAVAGSLFAIRYGIRQDLDLRAPVSQALIEFFRPSEEMVRAWEEPPPPSPAGRPSEEPPPPRERREGEFDRDRNSKLSAVEAPDRPADDLAPNSSRPPEEGGSSEEGDVADSSDFADANDADSPSGAPPPGDEKERPPDFPDQEDSDLIRKMQDAFANLMNKLKIPPRAGKGRRSAKSERESSDGEGQRSEQESAQKADGSPQGEGRPSASPDGQQMQQGGQQSQLARSEGGQESDQPGQQTSRSGAGQQDGAKELKAAEQLAAMGKLQEILGERAKNIKGEVMVEVSSGDQRLRTAYTETEATHRAAGTEIHRDEVPLDLQPYVRRYFEEVRKEAAPAER